MTSEEKINPSPKRPITLSPWLALLGALLLYGITLNHWVTLSSLPLVSKITGWDWHPLPLPWRPATVAPLFYILTAPVRILPVALQPLALNAFTAICAALTLALLAASVRLLPQDRTREQRQREGGEDSLLSVPAAFLPALFAVLMLGLQLTFWRNAISATGEMLDVLIFAFLIFCLLKFRISQNDNWLYAFAFVYGLGTTNDWALNIKGYFLFFVIAMIWIKGVTFFNWRFIARMAGWGLLGLLLYLLIPAMGSLGSDRADFGGLLKMEWQTQSFSLHQVPRWIALVAALPTLLPLFFAGIKWPSFEGEISAIGSGLTKYMFRLLHLVFLALALILFFNFKYSPSLRLQEAPSVGFLSFYYLGALCIGYFSGYILLVFGKAPAQSWERPNALVKVCNTVVVAALWILAVAAPCALFHQNFSSIEAGSKDVLANFSAEATHDLPDKTTVVLSDDPIRLYLLDAAYARQGKANKHILIDTASMPYREYIMYLITRYPELKKLVTSPEKLVRVLPTGSLVNFLANLSRTYPIYYLHPSFGYYFEAFYMKPHGLVYELHLYPRDALQPPPLTDQEIKANQQTWEPIKKLLPPLPPQEKLDPDVALIGFNYSLALDCWGIELQKAGHLQEARAALTEAAHVYPGNFIANINLDYNERLLKGNHKPLGTRDVIYRVLAQYRGLRYLGPVDEPDLVEEVGEMFASLHDFREAGGMFERRLQLLPDDPIAELDLAKVFIDLSAPDKALAYVRKLRANPAANQWEVSRVEALSYYAKNDYLSAEELMRKTLKDYPQDVPHISAMADFYRVTAYAALHDKKPDEATRRFNNALTYINQELQLMKADQKTADQTMVDALLGKAEVEMMLKSFQASITTLNQIMDLQPSNQTALLNRAIAENQLHQYQAAISDYNALRKIMRQQPYVVDLGLADIAGEQKNIAEEIRHLKRYLDTAPDDTPEYQQVKQRLRKLENR